MPDDDRTGETLPAFLRRTSPAALPSDDELHEAVRVLLRGLGYDPMEGDLRTTPDRYLRALREMTAAHRLPHHTHLAATFALDEELAAAMDGEAVAVRDVSFASLCEHHLLPFHGVAHVAYTHAGKVYGLSKLARIVEHHARRLQVQERIGARVAHDLCAGGVGVASLVVLESQHACMTCRGARQARASMRTLSWGGAATHGEDTPARRALRRELTTAVLGGRGGGL